MLASRCSQRYEYCCLQLPGDESAALVLSESLSSETVFISGSRDLFVSVCLPRSCISGFLLRRLSTSVPGFFLSLLSSGFRDRLSRVCLLRFLSLSLFLLRLGVSGFRDVLSWGFP